MNPPFYAPVILCTIKTHFIVLLWKTKYGLNSILKLKIWNILKIGRWCLILAHTCMLSHVQLSATPWIVVHWAPQLYWQGAVKPTMIFSTHELCLRVVKWLVQEKVARGKNITGISVFRSSAFPTSATSDSTFQSFNTVSYYYTLLIHLTLNSRPRASTSQLNGAYLDMCFLHEAHRSLSA